MFELGKLYEFQIGGFDNRYDNIIVFGSKKDAIKAIKEGFSRYDDRKYINSRHEMKCYMLTEMERVGLENSEKYVLEFTDPDFKQNNVFYVPINLAFKEYIKHCPIKMIKGDSSNDSGTESE
jgi:hypothetical protein